MKKIFAIPVKNNMLDGHFGHCPQFALVVVSDKAIVEERLVEAPPHEPGLLPPWLAEQGVTDIIAGGMGHKAIELFNKNGVNVFLGAPVSNPTFLVQSFLKGTIIFGENYCNH